MEARLVRARGNAEDPAHEVCMLKRKSPKHRNSSKIGERDMLDQRVFDCCSPLTELQSNRLSDPATGNIRVSYERRSPTNE
eukprot:768792-Hanusia_phi.AAC.8